jgi:hypothetical protein
MLKGNAGNYCRNVIRAALLICQLDKPVHAFLRLKLLHNLSYFLITYGF